MQASCKRIDGPAYTEGRFRAKPDDFHGSRADVDDYLKPMLDCIKTWNFDPVSG